MVWGVFLVEFVAKVWVSGRPLRFLRRRWLSVLFLVLPVLRIVRVIASLRARPRPGYLTGWATP